MPGKSRRTTDHHALANFGAARNADAASDHGVIPDRTIMANLNLVIQLNVIANNCILNCPAVDCRISTDLTIVTDDHASALRNLDPAPLITLKIRREAKTVSTYYRP